VHTDQGPTGRGYLGPYLPTAASALRMMPNELSISLRGHPVAPARAYAAARGWLGLAGPPRAACSGAVGGPLSGLDRRPDPLR